MRDILTDLGFAVGLSRLSEPWSRPSMRHRPGSSTSIWAEFVYPVARCSLPATFHSSSSRVGVESIDARFAAMPVIKKPVQRQVLQNLRASCARSRRIRHVGARRRALRPPWPDNCGRLRELPLLLNASSLAADRGQRNRNAERPPPAANQLISRCRKIIRSPLEMHGAAEFSSSAARAQSRIIGADHRGG